MGLTIVRRHWQGMGQNRLLSEVTTTGYMGPLRLVGNLAAQLCKCRNLRIADGMDGSCSNRRRDASYCRCQNLQLRGATPCKLQQSESTWPRIFFRFTGSPRVTRSLSTDLCGALRCCLFSRLDPCLVGMEACCTSHYWARELTRLGHEVRLIPPMYVKAYVKRGKSDAIDAEAICEAVTRPSSRPVRASGWATNICANFLS